MASSGSPDDPHIDAQEIIQTLHNTNFFRSLVENGSDAIVSIDEDSTIVYANRSVERIFGYTPTEMIGEDLTMIMPERFQNAHFSALDAYLETSERTIDWNDIELPAKHKDGHEITLSITFEQHDYDGDRLFSGIMRDVSERKSHEENLITLQEMARDLTQIQDRTEIAKQVVKAAEKTLGFPIVSVFFYREGTTKLEPVAHSDAVRETLDEVPTLGEDSLAWEAFQEAETRRYTAEKEDETAIFRPGGPISSEYIFPLNDHGCLLVSTTDERDLDDRTYTLAQILAANAESALERAKRETEKKKERERLERFANIVSHDLRDPINTARATLAVARAGEEEAFGELDGLFDRMDTLIEDVLLLAKQGKAIGETKPLNLEHSVTAAWTTIEAPAAELAVDSLPTAAADPERLQTLFENLFRNAIEHAGPSVTVHVGELANGSGFYVEDDGPGFRDIDTDQLFEYGYTTEKENTGFGLNIVSEIVSAHEWDITIAESASGGARFEITGVETN